MRKNLLTRISLVLLSICLFQQATRAQIDPHFSQYYVYPSWLNPALTGAFDGDYRVAGIYRNQWGNVSAPFSTPGVAVDFTTNKNVNLGGSVLTQKAGDGGFTYTTAYGNFAYTGVKFGALGQQRLVFGIQAGIIQRRFDPSKLTFGDQWNPVTGYNPGNTSGEVVNTKASTSFDAGAGVLYYDAQPGKKANIFAGFSAAHLTRPEDDFSMVPTGIIPMRLTGHAGVRIAISDVLSLTPNLLYVRQGTATEKMVGAYAQLKANDETEVLVGANYRFKDAFAPFVGFTFRNMVLGASYDVNASDLGKMARGSNSFEISLSFIGRKSAKTPEVEFVCPRL
jgi:type IX secretion system PorP/SprF family membrane protein